MRKPLFVLLLCTSLASAAEDPETLAERSQSKARKVIDSAVAAIGGREALQGIETLKLQLQGETWTRLQMPTPSPPFEPGSVPGIARAGSEGQPAVSRAARQRRRLRRSQHGRHQIGRRHHIRPSRAHGDADSRASRQRSSSSSSTTAGFPI